MANWLYKLELGDFYHEYPDDLTIQEVAQKTSERIKGLLEEIRKEKEFSEDIDRLEYKELSRLIYQEETVEMAEELENDILPLFEEIAEDEEMDENDFDGAMEELYNWADTPLEQKFNGAKLCWVDTFSRRKENEE